MIRRRNGRRERLSLEELAARCLKPQSAVIGNWMARRVSRPLALRVTWVLQPWPISANVVTAAAWLTALVSAAMFGRGDVVGWLAGAALLQAWYLLDHVDGQTARLRGTASLDGVQLDYLMHHAIALTLSLAIGWGFARAGMSDIWPAVGWLWSMGLLLVNLRHDAAYKAFIQRLKRLDGELRVRGGGGGRPTAPKPAPGSFVPWGMWMLRKCCEMHVVMNLLSLVAVGSWLAGDSALFGPRCLVVILAAVSSVVAIGGLAVSQLRQDVEREFAAWYRVDADSELIFDGGWWRVNRRESGETGERRQVAEPASPRSS